MYQAIEEYKSLASGVTWDNPKGADIKDGDPVSEAFWERYMKSPVSKFHPSFFSLFNYYHLAPKTHQAIHIEGLQLLQ